MNKYLISYIMIKDSTTSSLVLCLEYLVLSYSIDAVSHNTFTTTPNFNNFNYEQWFYGL